MEIISDIVMHKERIESSLQRWACAAEHNYYCYVYNIESHEKPFVYVFDDEMMILAKQDTHTNKWYVFTDILAPQEKKFDLFIQFLNHVYALPVPPAKVVVEFPTILRKQVLEEFKKNSEYHANKINYSLTWPVFDLETWSGEKMEGKDWKDMRYYWNKYFREHKVEFVSVQDADKEEMKQVVLEWKKQRTTGDKTYYEYYLHAIACNFEGYDHYRIMKVDGKIVAITAGFKSREGYYYSSIGLYTRDIDRTGEIANMDDLLFLKKQGYRYVDFGGGEKTLTEFKKKFHPTTYYQTHIFSIAKKTPEHVERGVTKISPVHAEHPIHIFKDITAPDVKQLILETISRNGFTPEHDYEHWCSHQSAHMKPCFVSFGGQKGLFAVIWDEEEWQIISELLAPEQERAALFLQFLTYLFANEHCKKVMVEFNPDMRKQLLREIKLRPELYPLTMGSIISRFYTPILSLQAWDPALAGSQFSNLRKCKNRYHRNFKIQLLFDEDAKKISYESYAALVHSWRKIRKSKDRAYYEEYLYFFKNGFRGSAVSMAILIDGKLSAVAAAWIVPNTQNKTVYYAISLHDYSTPELGDFLALTFLDELKRRGYDYLDFGSSDERLLSYKKKFGIMRQYETVVFYIKSKNPIIPKLADRVDTN